MDKSILWFTGMVCCILYIVLMFAAGTAITFIPELNDILVTDMDLELTAGTLIYALTAGQVKPFGIGFLAYFFYRRWRP